MKKKIKKNNQKTFIQKLKKSRGSVTFKLILAVIIIGSVAFVSGIFPTTQMTPPDPNAPRYRPNLDEEIGNRDSLQLKTIDFETCSKISAVDLLVDYSGSMAPDFGPRKLPATHNALKTFGEKLTDESVVALHAFNTRNYEVIPFSEFKDVKDTYNSQVESLNEPDGATYTRSALTYVKAKIELAKQKWQNHQFTLVFLSDGIPERLGTATKMSCPNPRGGMRNFSLAEDPNQAPSVADQIKNLDVRIFAISILDQNDQCFSDALRDLMQNVASPDSYYETYNPDDLSDIYDNVVFEMCEDIKS